MKIKNINRGKKYCVNNVKVKLKISIYGNKKYKK